MDGAIAGWEGEAANKFRSSLEELPGELGTVASAFDAASSSIRSFAGQLTDFQNNAHYYASRIKSLEEELKSSQRQHDEAEATLQAARFRQSLATDPISLKTAVDAVSDGISKLKSALDAVEANSGELAKLRSDAQTNREDYEQAVRACCTALQDATASTTRSNGAPRIAVGTLVAGVVSTFLHDVRDHESAYDTPAIAPIPAKTPPTATSAPPVVAATGTSAAAGAAIAWARGYLGTSDDDEHCLEFVQSAYLAAGVNIGSAESAADYWNINPKGYTEHPGDTNPPVGALVFWGPTESNPYGHVGIYVGAVPGRRDDEVISTASWGEPATQPDVHYFSLSERNEAGYPYLGWMMPTA